jgi:diguanylate cyclase (GGDEF)-like protein
MSMTDSLTGLSNRFFLDRHLPSDIALSRRRWADLHRVEASLDADYVFFLIDIDHFKRVNDEHGHLAGDLVLQRISQTIRRVFRESDYLVRWGGEEILVVTRDSDRRAAAQLAERLREEVAMTDIRLDSGLVIRRTCSIGFCAFPLIRRDFAALRWEQTVELADVCMYAAKKTARDAWVGLLDATPIENAFEEIRQAPAHLQAEGRISVVSSIPAAQSLVWPAY